MSLHVRDQPGNQAGYWVSFVFAGLSVWLALGPLQFTSPVASPNPVPASVIDPTPIRRPSPRALYTVGQFTYHCNLCHRIEPISRAAGQEFTKHAEIHLAHGMNTRCLNCHHPLNRETFVDDFGEEIPWDQPQLLCAKCHGPVFRDWQHGSHGRINGFWNSALGEQVRLKCIECHDPHHPPFPPLASAAGPKTLRTLPHQGGAHGGARNPLRVTDHDLTSGAATHAQRGPTDE